MGAPMTQSKRPSVAAIVLNFNGREVTLQALASLTALGYEPLEIVVVDNGSTDGSFEAVAAAFPEVTQLRTEVNLGPAGGANLGVRHALDRGHDYLLILNNDIEVAPDLVTEMVRVAESGPAIGIVGPKAFFYWDRDRIWTAGGRITFREAVTKERGTGELDRGQYDRDEETGYVNGCAQLVKRAVFEEVGLWDPIYRLSFEDADFCLRARRAGWRSWYAHRARLWHMVSVSTGPYRAPKTYQTARSTAIFVRRYAGPWQWVTAVAMILLSLPAALVREALRGNASAVAAKARGFFDGFFRTEIGEPPRWEGAGEGGRSPAAAPAPEAGEVGAGAR